MVINGGAWQRTITPVQLERRASETGVSVAELMATLKPEDLPSCYSFVRISPENGVPVAAVRYWRQTGAGGWAFGTSCGASQ